jgi:hypothetical protein
MQEVLLLLADEAVAGQMVHRAVRLMVSKRTAAGGIAAQAGGGGDREWRRFPAPD